MIISHVKIIAFQLSLFKGCPLYNKQKNTWVLGNTRFISRVEHDISLVRCADSWDIMFNTRNKSGISAYPCIILYLFCNFQSFNIFIFYMINYFYLWINMHQISLTCLKTTYKCLSKTIVVISKGRGPLSALSRIASCKLFYCLLNRDNTRYIYFILLWYNIASKTPHAAVVSSD
jgi:hypothetical protein